MTTMADNKDKKVLNVPHLRFPEFSGEWEKYTIGDLCEEFKSGKNIKAESIQEEGVYPVFGGNGLRGYTDRYNHDGDYVLIGRQGALCGNVRFVTGKTYITEHAIAAKATNDNYTRYLEYLFVRLNLGQFSDQSAQPGLAVNKLLKIETYVPSKAEQLKIAFLLRLLDERIATQNKIIEKLETLIKGFVDSIFTANKFPKVPFKEIYVRAGEGGTPATSNPEYYDNGTIPFIKIDDLQNKYIKTNKDCITELGLQKSSAWIVPANSIIYSNGATIGAISINLFPVCTKQGILGVVPKADINVEFLYYFMTSTAFTKAVERIVTEGTMRTAYLKDINHIPCPVPYPVKQDEIAKMLSTLSEKLENEVIFQMKLQKQKEFLLSQMFI